MDEKEKVRQLLLLLSKPDSEERRVYKFLSSLLDNGIGSSGFEMFDAKRASNGRDLEISGVAAAFGNLDRQNEIIDAGAFQESLAHHRQEKNKTLDAFKS